MRTPTMKRGASIVAATGALALTLAACGGGGTAGGETGGTAGGTEGCDAFADYGSFSGEKVTISSSIRDVEADALDQSWAKFEECTGIDIVHTGTGEFEQQIQVQAEGNNAPDLAIFPQPALLGRMARGGFLVQAPDSVKTNAQEGWSQDWQNYGTVDGTFYGAPLMASVKSFIWYSPSVFADKGYDIPKTWDDLMALTAKIAKDNDDVTRPWCAGIESGTATGWPATDWVEDLVLRTGGPDVYDQWVTNQIPFDDPQIVKAVDTVGGILKNNDYVNGGIGDSRSIATTSFNDGGLPVLDGTCYMYRMASFYETQWPEGTVVAEDGDVWAFLMPGMKEGDIPLLSAGEFVGAFNDKETTQAVQTYLSSSDWANSRVKVGGVISANLGLDPQNASSDLLRYAIELLQTEGATIRFDGSDMMPAEVGAGSFWTEMTNWIDGKDTQSALAAIQATWPKD